MFLLFDIGGTTTRMALSRTGDALDEVKLFPTNHNFTEAPARPTRRSRRPIGASSRAITRTS